MTNERRPSPALPDQSEDPAEGTPSFHAGTDAGVPIPGQDERVGGPGPGPEKDDTNEPELGIEPYASADAAGGGYGSLSGRSSGGTGDGEAGSPLEGSAMDDGTTSGATGATPTGPTSWLRGAAGDRRSEASDAPEGPGESDESDDVHLTIAEDGPGVARSPVGNDNIREGRVSGLMGTPHPSAGQGEGG